MSRQFAGCVALLGLVLAGAVAMAQEVNPDAILGDWTTEKQEAIFHIYKEGDSYHGRITWTREPLYPEGDKEAGVRKHDRKNPDKAKRDVPLLGYVLLKDFKYKDGKWTGGTIYDPTEGNTYKCNLKLEKGNLKVRGFIGVALLGRTVEWYRPTEELLRETESVGEKLK